MPTKKEVMDSLLSAAKHWADESNNRTNSQGANWGAKTSKNFIEAAVLLQQIFDDNFEQTSEETE